MVVHLITLEVELDASFNRALPIIKNKVPPEYHNACQSILIRLFTGLSDWSNKGENRELLETKTAFLSDL